MKRALAERAKLQQHSSVQAPAPPPPTKTANLNTEPPAENGGTPQERPLKIPRIEKPMVQVPKAQIPSPRETPKSPRPKKPTDNKRRLSNMSTQSKVDEEDNSSSFYLKHQNRALATELKSLRHSLNELQEERDERRNQTKAAFEHLLQVRSIWSHLEQTTIDTIHKHTPNDPPSTGQDSVEWCTALEQAIVSLGGEPTDTLEAATANIARRAQSLQECLQKRILQSSTTNGSETDHLRTVQLQLDEVTARASALQAELSETRHSRQELMQRERQLRRNVYRLSAGILTPEQLVQKVEGPDDDEWNAQVQLEKQSLLLKTEKEEPTQSSSAASAPVSSGISDQQVQELESKIKSLEDALQSAEQSIREVNAQLSEKERKITALTQTQLSEEDAKKLETIESTTLQLKLANESIESLQRKLVEKTEQWSLALGNEKAALATLDDNLAKFNKRWNEVTEQNDDEDNGVIRPETELAKELGEVRHQLAQALENVRQAETARENLKLAVTMNKEHQAKLEETKSKYVALQKSTMSNAARPETPRESTASAEKGTAKSSRSSGNDKTFEKYQKLKKDYQALRSRLDQAEKEREHYTESNFQLLKQVSEKDEMNAKSLSTILHLKKMTEKLNEERDTLEQTAKSASQLALAARLATNAKERVSEEVIREKKTLEDRVQELEELCSAKQAELDRVTSEWSEASGKMAVKDSELANVLKRSDELVAENEQKREEVRKLADVVSKSERQAKDSKEKLSEVMGQASSGESGAVEQLKTQISVLKSRLACPVCHYRDKECIILRCRHMHCKQCVDERISNRSRKCPTCNIKFSENDVGDIWLS